jgi:hypothetical protein
VASPANGWSLGYPALEQKPDAGTLDDAVKARVEAAFRARWAEGSGAAGARPELLDVQQALHGLEHFGETHRLAQVDVDADGHRLLLGVAAAG